MPPLRVLFFETDPLTSDVRLRPLLDLLVTAGQIRYARVDRDLAVSGDLSAEYDVLLTHRQPSRRQAAWLQRAGIPFLYDIDDLLLHPAPDGAATDRQAALAWCLTQAHRVMSPSRRLLEVLGQRLAQGLGGREVLLPNAGLETPPPPKPPARPSLLWVSSSLPAPAEETAEVARGIADAARDLGTDVVLVGRFADAVQAALPGHRHIAWLSFSDYMRFLRDGAFIAAAPLSTGLAGEEQAFVDCKSDIKAAQYASSRVAAVYSPAAPYAESDLPCLLAATNTAPAWRQAITGLAADYPNCANLLADHPALAARRPSVLAARLLEELVRTRDRTRPFPFRAIATPAFARHIERQFRDWRRRWRRH